MGIIETWTLIAVILHCCGVNYFATLPVIDWPWHWSCCCLMLWACLFYLVLIVAWLGLNSHEAKAKKRRMQRQIERMEKAGHTVEADLLRKNLKL